MELSQEEIKKAFQEGQMDIIDSLLQSEIDVNAPIIGTYALQWACLSGIPWASYTLDVVTKLITHEADVDLEDKDGGNALDYALSSLPFQPHVAQLLLDCSKKGVNRFNPSGYNYLWATWGIESVKFLVENGIDINHVVTNRGDNKTYLDFAHQDEFDYLRSVGAKLYSEL